MFVEDFFEEGLGVCLIGSIVFGKSLIEVVDVLLGCLIVFVYVEVLIFFL